MYTSIRIKRRLKGDVGAPNNLDQGELAYNEVDGTLYIGVSYSTTDTINLSSTNITLSGS